MQSALFRKAPLALAVSLASAFSTQAVVAEDQVAIEEVVVTAQKREQNLQETPIAITALDATALEARGIDNVAQAAKTAPNVRLVTSPGNSNSATINIRGAVTVNPALTLEPTVGMYLDGIYIGKNSGSIFDFADLERVEVLRGPQGTLYGKNTLGGAINLITKKPSGEFGGKLKVGLGSEALKTSRLSIDAPAVGEVGEGAGRLSTSLALTSTQRDGFYDNDYDDTDFGNVNAKGGRVAALWQPVESFEALYAYDFSKTDQHPNLNQVSRAGALAPLSVVQAQSDDRLDSSSQNDALHDDVEIGGHSLILTQEVGDVAGLGEVTLKSLTGNRTMETLDVQDWDGTGQTLLRSSRDQNYDQWSQEFQMLGKTERVNYVAGLYYFEEQGDVYNPLDLVLYASPHIDAGYGFDNSAWAAFTQAEWRPPVLDDRLTLTAGLRYTEERKQVYRQFEVGGFTVLPKTRVDDDFENLSPTFVAAYQLTDEVNVYAKVAQGWKSGGFNAEVTSLAALEEPFDAEEVTSYEVGAKSQWLDNRLQVNVATFLNKHDNMQVSQFQQVSASSILTNAGEAEISGGELEIVAIPVDNLELSLAYGYLNTEYKEYMDTCRLGPSFETLCPSSVVPGQRYDAKDENRVPYSPENTFTLGAQYTLPLAVGELVSRVDWSFQDDQEVYPDPYSYTNTTIGTYHLIDARMTWQKLPVGDNGNEMAFSVWGKNLADEEYTVTGIEWGPLTNAIYGDPRSFGVDATLSF